ncbi:MAG: OmpA family protein, partial [Myxococcota bacterium]
MKSMLFVTALLASSTAHAADSAISVGLFGGAFFTDQLEVLGDTPVITPRVGYWMNPTLGFELDLALMPAGRTQVGIPDKFGYFGMAPSVNMVGRVFEEEPVSLLLSVGVGPFFKKVNDDGALNLPTGSKLDVDFAGQAGPGLLIPLGDIAIRTEYRWLLNVGSENWENRGDSFLDGMWTLGVMYLPMGPRDADEDGLADDVDTCIDQAEDIDEFEDADGCPDPDNDGDGVLDAADACKGEAEDKDSFEDENGCPDPDNDGDTVLDADDACRDVKGTVATKGCPDADADGLVDDEDECVNDAGPLASFGCPDRDGDRVPDFRDDCPDEKAPEGIDASRSDGCMKKFYIAEDKIVILEKVQFASGKAVIQKASFEMLDGIAATLGKQKGIKKMQVEGHTDSVGDDAKNLKLSQARADAVKTYLVSKGVEADRLVAIGFGETKPVGDNATKAGQDQNRRVEFNILEQDLGKGLKKQLKEGAQEGKIEKIDETPAPAPE